MIPVRSWSVRVKPARMEAIREIVQQFRQDLKFRNPSDTINILLDEKIAEEFQKAALKNRQAQVVTTPLEFKFINQLIASFLRPGPIPAPFL